MRTYSLKLKAQSHNHKGKSNKCDKGREHQMGATDLQSHNKKLGKEDICAKNRIHYKYNGDRNTNGHLEGVHNICRNQIDAYHPNQTPPVLTPPSLLLTHELSPVKNEVFLLTCDRTLEVHCLEEWVGG